MSKTQQLWTLQQNNKQTTSSSHQQPAERCPSPDVIVDSTIPLFREGGRGGTPRTNQEGLSLYA